MDERDYKDMVKGVFKLRFSCSKPEAKIALDTYSVLSEDSFLTGRHEAFDTATQEAMQEMSLAGELDGKPADCFYSKSGLSGQPSERDRS